ncbi:MAG: hypothetical protein L0387_34865 [Acidobacteria bacterium]|nr:hypothetical protein [Acidobacteriota bacterium]
MKMHALTILLQQGHNMQEHAGHVMPPPPDAISIFDHHLAGVLLILWAVLAYLEQSEVGRYRWVRYSVPLPIFLIGGFLLIFRDDADPWFRWLLEGRIDLEPVQHKLFESLAILLGFIELFRRTGSLKHKAWGQILNTLMFGGGVAILFHKGPHSEIVHIQHFWMAIVAIALALSRIVGDLNWGGRWVRIYAGPALLLALGLQFALYVE